MQLTAVFSIFKDCNSDLHDVTAKIILPEGIEKVDGKLEWQGDIPYGTTRTLTANVRSIKTGEYLVEARADCIPSKSAYYVGNATLYVSVTKNGSSVSTTPNFDYKKSAHFVDINNMPPPQDSPRNNKLDNSKSEKDFVNPLHVAGNAVCYVTDPSNSPEDTASPVPLVWGGIWIYVEGEYEPRWTYTGPVYCQELQRNLDPGEFYLTVENPNTYEYDEITISNARCHGCLPRNSF